MPLGNVARQLVSVPLKAGHGPSLSLVMVTAAGEKKNMVKKKKTLAPQTSLRLQPCFLTLTTLSVLNT